MGVAGEINNVQCIIIAEFSSENDVKILFRLQNSFFFNHLPF